MVYADSQYTHERQVAQNPTEGHGQMYAVRQAGHNTTPSHRLRGEIGDLGTDLQKGSSDTEDRHQTYTQGMAALSLFRIMAR